MRGSARRRIDRALGAWFPIAQTAVAAGVAWYLARLIVGQPLPFFAPASAVISLGVARGQPRRRAVELVLGVAIGIASADLLGRLIGKGAVQIGIVVGLTMLAALLVGAGTILVNQAAISAVLVMTLPVTGQGAAPDRFFDALIGGGRRAPAEPGALSPRSGRDGRPGVQAGARRARRSPCARSPTALVNRDLEGAERALLRARSLDDEIAEFYDALAVARETAVAVARSAPGSRADGAVCGRRPSGRLRGAKYSRSRPLRPRLRYARASPSIPSSLSRVDARHRRCRVPEQLADPEPHESARRLAIRAAEHATAVLARQNDLQTRAIRN